MTPHVGPLIVTGGAVWIACGVAVVALLWRAGRRPLDAVDAYCDAVDRELDGLPSREENERRLTAIRGGLDEVGNHADRTWASPVDVGDMLTSDGLGHRPGGGAALPPRESRA